MSDEHETNKPRRAGRPPTVIDPGVMDRGTVDTYSRMSDLKGEDRQRRILWERRRKQAQLDARRKRQQEARDRANKPNAAVGVDLLKVTHDRQAAPYQVTATSMEDLGEINAQRLSMMADVRNLSDQIARQRREAANLQDIITERLKQAAKLAGRS